MSDCTLTPCLSYELNTLSQLLLVVSQLLHISQLNMERKKSVSHLIFFSNTHKPIYTENLVCLRVDEKSRNFTLEQPTPQTPHKHIHVVHTGLIDTHSFMHQSHVWTWSQVSEASASSQFTGVYFLHSVIYSTLVRAVYHFTFYSFHPASVPDFPPRSLHYKSMFIKTQTLFTPLSLLTPPTFTFVKVVFFHSLFLLLLFLNIVCSDIDWPPPHLRKVSENI